jgi:DNA-binding transcriptional ArsR family regulator
MPADAVLESLAEPNRRRIVEALRAGERPVGDLVAALGLAQPSVSKHLKTLRAAGVVTVRADAQRRLYRLCPEPLRELDAWLQPFRELWADRLDALERHLDTLPDEPWEDPS